MSKDDRNTQSTGANTGSRGFQDDDDDFLDNMMEDLMGTGGNDEESEPAKPTLDNEKSTEVSSEPAKASSESEIVDKVEEVIEDKIEQEEHIEPRRPARRGGLLSRFSGAASSELAEVDDEPIKVDSDSTEDTSSKVDSNTQLGEDNKPARRGRVPLLNRVSSNRDRVKEGDDNDVSHDSRSVPKEDSGSVWGDSSNTSEDTSVDIEGVGYVDEGLQVGNDDSVVEDSSIFDDMLEGLNEEEDIERLRRQAELDPEVLIPLEKPGMDEIIVTADGKTLAEMIPGLRSGNKPIDKVVSDIINQEDIVEVGGKKFSDDRYTKHVEVIDKETLEQEKRVALSMKFLQRNAEFTEQEKIIMRNLGLTNEQLSKVMKSTELSMKQKEEFLGLGRYGAEKHFKGRRYRTTVGDSAMLEFLVKFKFANTRILRWISNEPQGRTWRKLSRLRNSGLVESQTIIGIPDLWGATTSGTAITGYDLKPGLRPMPKIITISSDMGVNYIAACLWFNSVNVLNLDDFPAHNREIALQSDGRDRVQGETLVSELEIRSSLGKEINPSSTTMQTLGDERLYEVISSNVRSLVNEWIQGGKVGPSPEFQLGNEYMWVLFPTSSLTLSYHVPDLVIKRERGPNGEPRSIAVEMERYEKSNDRYDQIMLAYKLDEHLYDEVIWITPNARVLRTLDQAAAEVGFDRYRVLPIIMEDGYSYDKQDIWMI